jgi:hypothetical protein
MFKLVIRALICFCLLGTFSLFLARWGLIAFLMDPRIGPNNVFPTRVLGVLLHSIAFYWIRVLLQWNIASQRRQNVSRSRVNLHVF